MKLKYFSVGFTPDIFDAIQAEAARARVPRNEVIQSAARHYLVRDIAAPAEAAQPAKPKPSAPGKVVKDTLANTEIGFREGVKAACEKIAKNTRLKLLMSTGITMGEDIANNIERDLLG